MVRSRNHLRYFYPTTSALSKISKAICHFLNCLIEHLQNGHSLHNSGRIDTKHSSNNSHYKGGQGSNNSNDGGGTKGGNNGASISGGGGFNPQFQEQEDQMDIKGVVINHSILDHRTPVSQQFDTFYKAVKVAAGKLNPNLVKPIQTLIGLTNAGYSVDFPEASLWTKGGVEDIHKKEMYSCLWLEKKGKK
eukprot:jgi/Psemu1/56556/gm1.56556_g